MSPQRRWEATVVLFGGIGTVVATLDNWDNTNRSYSFTNVSGLLPVANYHATVSVIENANGSALKMVPPTTPKARRTPTPREPSTTPYRSLCFNSPVLCFPDQRSAALAALVQFDSVPVSPTPLILQGYLRRPMGQGPFPAVVLLHGCNGSPETLDQDWGVKVASWGYVTLTIDSFGPRGIKNTCGGSRPADVFFDAYRGLDFLVRQQFVDPKRVAVVGFSQDGWLTLWSAERGEMEQMSENKLRSPSIHPCRKLVAGEDDLGISRQKSDGAAVQLIVYPEAYHGFDVPSLQTPVRYFGPHLEFNKSATDQSSDALRGFLEATMGH